MDNDEVTPLAQRGHGRGIDKRREPKPCKCVWKTRIDPKTVERLKRIREGM